MSTNANIVFKYDDRTIETYKHWDGYPDVTLELLSDFLEWMPSGRFDQLDYVGATWFYYVKERENTKELTDTPNHNDDRVLSYGIRPRKSPERAMIEHTYVVDLSERVVKHHRGNFTSEDQTIVEEIGDREADNRRGF